MPPQLLEELESAATKEPTGNQLAGTTVSALFNVSINTDKGAFFVFKELLVREEGVFRLEFTMLQLLPNAGQTVRRARCWSTLFRVHGSRSFPGMAESTPLTRVFSEQGVRLRLRKDPRAAANSKRNKTIASKLELLQQRQQEREQRREFDRQFDQQHRQLLNKPMVGAPGAHMGGEGHEAGHVEQDMGLRNSGIGPGVFYSSMTSNFRDPTAAGPAAPYTYGHDPAALHAVAGMAAGGNGGSGRKRIVGEVLGEAGADYAAGSGGAYQHMEAPQVASGSVVHHVAAAPGQQHQQLDMTPGGEQAQQAVEGIDHRLTKRIRTADPASWLMNPYGHVPYGNVPDESY